MPNMFTSFDSQAIQRKLEELYTLTEAYLKQQNEMIYNQNQMLYELINLIKENNSKED